MQKYQTTVARILLASVFLGVVLLKLVAITSQPDGYLHYQMTLGQFGLPLLFAPLLILVQLLASQHRYRVMAIIAIANFLIKALMNYLLAPSYGVNGIMLATGMMYLLSFVCYFVVAWRLPKS